MVAKRFPLLDFQTPGFPLMIRHILGLCLSGILLFLAGCDSGPRIVKVSGTVLIDGKPVPLGFVQVAPAGFRAASGKINKDGTFTLTTTNDNDGCVTGTHPVAVIALETLGPSKQMWHAPKKYNSTETSGLKVTIDKPTNDLKIERTWDGGKPFIEKFDKE